MRLYEINSEMLTYHFVYNSNKEKEEIELDHLWIYANKTHLEFKEEEKKNNPFFKALEEKVYQKVNLKLLLRA